MPTLAPQLALHDTPRARVIEALRAYDTRPAGCPDYAHRVVVRDALRAARVPAETIDAVAVARRFIGLPNRGLM